MSLTPHEFWPVVRYSASKQTDQVWFCFLSPSFQLIQRLWSRDTVLCKPHSGSSVNATIGLYKPCAIFFKAQKRYLILVQKQHVQLDQIYSVERIKQVKRSNLHHLSWQDSVCECMKFVLERLTCNPLNASLAPYIQVFTMHVSHFLIISKSNNND